MTSKASLRNIQRKRIQLAQSQAENSPEVRDGHLRAEQKLRERLEVFFVQLFAFLTSGQDPGPSKPVARRRWAAFAPHGHEPNLCSALQVISKCLFVEWAFPRVLNPKSEVPEMEFFIPHAPARAANDSAETVMGGATRASSKSTPDPAADIAEAFQNNSWGLSEPHPDTSELVDGETIEGFLIPALAFDQKGARLGRGKGYFDKYLSRFGSAVAEGPASNSGAESISGVSRESTRSPRGMDHESSRGLRCESERGLHRDTQLKTKIGIAFDDQILSEDLVTEAHDITMDIVLSESRLLVSQAWWNHHSHHAKNAQGPTFTLRQAFPGAELFEAPLTSPTGQQLKGLNS